MLIGTDCNNWTNIQEGYLMIGFDGRFLKLKADKPIPEGFRFDLFQTCGNCKHCERHNNPQNISGLLARSLPCLQSTTVSISELIEAYIQDKKAIDSANGADTDDKFVHSTIPSHYTDIYQVLQLADSVQMYRGELFLT